MRRLRKVLPWLGGVYDQHWLRAFLVWATAWYGGVLVQRASDHHGSWEWAGWTCFGASVIFVSSVASRLRKSKCTKLHAQIIEEQRSKAMWS